MNYLLLLFPYSIALIGAGIWLVGRGRRDEETERPATLQLVGKESGPIAGIVNGLMALQRENSDLPTVPRNFALLKHWFAEAKRQIAIRCLQGTRAEEVQLLKILNEWEAQYNLYLRTVKERRWLTDAELASLEIQSRKEELRTSIAQSKAQQDAIQRRRHEPTTVLSEEERKFNAAWQDLKRDRRWKAQEAFLRTEDMLAVEDAYKERDERIKNDKTLTPKQRSQARRVAKQDYEEQKRTLMGGAKFAIFDREEQL